MKRKANFFKTGPYRVDYRGKYIGTTLAAPRLEVIPELYEAKRYYLKGRAVRKIITNMKFVVAAEVKDTDNRFAELLPKNAERGKVIFAEHVLATGGELCFSPAAGKQNIRYRFPRAVLIPEAAGFQAETGNGGLKLKFEVYEDSEGVLIQKIS